MSLGQSYDRQIVHTAATGVPTVLNAKDTAYGAKGDGTTDDATAIQAALTAARTAGGGTVYLPQGTYIIGTGLTLGQAVNLVGAGWGTVLKAKNSANINMLSLYSVDSIGARVANLTLDGNKANQASGTGITFDWTGNAAGTTSPLFICATIENVYVRFTKGDGVALTNTTNGMTAVMRNVQVIRCDGNGFNIQASDGQFSDCQAQKCGLAGWVVGPTAALSHLANCMGNDNGQITAASGHGFKIVSGGCQLAGCSAQDNTMHGFYIPAGTGGSDNMFTGCFADSNSFGNAGASAAGFYVDTQAQRVIISGCHSRDRFAGGSRTQAYGYYVNGTADYIRIDSSAYNNVTADWKFAGSGTNNSLGTTSVDQRRVSRPSAVNNAICETIPRYCANADSGSMTSAALRVLGVTVVQAFQPVTAITLLSGVTAMSAGTHQWFTLHDASTGALIAVTTDDTSTAWAADTDKTLNLSVVWTPTVDTKVYVGVCVVATTPPSVAIISPRPGAVGGAGAGGSAGMQPVLAFQTGSALTNPASAPNPITLGSVTPSTKVGYAHLT